MSTQHPDGPLRPHPAPGGQQPHRSGAHPDSYPGGPHPGAQREGGYAGWSGPSAPPLPSHGGRDVHGGTGTGRPRNGLGTTALVLGIVALLFSWTVVAGVLGLAALVLGVVGARRARRGEATNRGTAVAGAVLGGLGLLLAVVALVLFAAFLARFAGCLQASAQGASEQELQQCIADEFGVPATSL